MANDIRFQFQVQPVVLLCHPFSIKNKVRILVVSIMFKARQIKVHFIDINGHCLTNKTEKV